MARIRTIKPEFFQHEDLSALSPLARLTFIGLWCHADRAGKLHDKPRKITALLFPYAEKHGTVEEVDAALDDLARIGCLTRYVANDEKYLKINNFERHQRPHPKEPTSIIPEPDLGEPCKNTASREKISTSRLGREGDLGDLRKGREGNGDTAGREQTRPEPCLADAPASEAPMNGSLLDAGEVWELWRETAEAANRPQKLIASHKEILHLDAIARWADTIPESLGDVLRHWWASPYQDKRNLGMFLHDAPEVVHALRERRIFAMPRSRQHVDEEARQVENRVAALAPPRERPQVQHTWQRLIAEHEAKQKVLKEAE